MNKDNRKQLEKAIELMENAKSIVEEIKDDEQGKFDNLSDGLQASEKGQRLEEIVTYLDDAFNLIEESIDNVNSASE